MIKDVIINIVGIQGVDGESDTIEFTTEGRFGIKDGRYFLTYDEGSMMENADIRTRLIINNENSVILQRSGTIKSKMLIENGVRNMCFYSTPHGDLTIGIFGEKIEFDFNESGGSLNLEYTIDSNLKLISRNVVNITVKEVKI